MALGEAALQEKRYDESAACFARAGQASTNFSTAYFFQAIALALAGRNDEARLCVDRGVQLEPGFRIRLFYEHGLAPALADRLVEGAKLLGLE